MNDLLTARNIKIFEAVLSGATYKSVSDTHSITCTRVRQIVIKIRRKIKPTSANINVSEFRNNKAHWINELNKYKALSNVQKVK